MLWKVQDSNLRCPTLFIALPSIKPSATYPVCLRPLGQPSNMSLILMSLIVRSLFGFFENLRASRMAGDTFLDKYEYLTIALFNIVAAATQRFVKVDSCITYLYISLFLATV